MEAFIAFKYLHIVTMFFAVALALSGEIVVRRVAGSRDVRAIRTTTSRVKAVSGNLASILFLVGIGFGVAAALAGQIDLLRPWLVLSYVAVGLAFLIGMTVTDPWVARLERAAADSPEDAASDALREVIADRRVAAGTWALQGLIASIVFFMVVKPFG